MKFLEVIKKFRDKFLGGCVECSLCNDYDVVSSTFPTMLGRMLSCVIEAAEVFVKEKVVDIQDVFCSYSVKEAMTALNQGLGEAGGKPEKFLPEVWRGSFEEEFLTTAFWALALMDDKLQHRAEVAFELEKYKVEFGTSGYSEKLGKVLSNYYTIFDGHVLCIDPVKGKVYRSFKKYEYAGLLRVECNYLYIDNLKIAEITKTGEIRYTWSAMLEESKDLKKAEREKKRLEGKKVKETRWLTTHLGYLKGTNCYVRTHTLIALMVYGFEACKYAVMEAGSILSIDHQNAKHDDNRVDNLAITSRSSNTSKGSKNVKIFDFGLYFLGMPQMDFIIEEEKEKEKEWEKEPTEEEREAFIAKHSQPVTVELLVEKYGCEVCYCPPEVMKMLGC